MFMNFYSMMDSIIVHLSLHSYVNFPVHHICGKQCKYRIHDYPNQVMNVLKSHDQNNRKFTRRIQAFQTARLAS